MTEPHKKDVGTILYWLRRQLPDHVVKNLEVIAKPDDSFVVESMNGMYYSAKVHFYTICKDGEEFHIPYFEFQAEHLNGNQTNFWIGQWAQEILGRSHG